LFGGAPVAAPATSLFGAPASSSGSIFANLGGIAPFSNGSSRAAAPSPAVVGWLQAAQQPAFGQQTAAPAAFTPGGSTARAGTNNEFQPSAGPTIMSSICTKLKDQSLESHRLVDYQPHTLKSLPSSGSPVGVQVAGVSAPPDAAQQATAATAPAAAAQQATAATAPPATAQQATAATAPPATAQQATAATAPPATFDRVQATSSTFSSIILKVVSFRSFKNVSCLRFAEIGCFEGCR
jgi:hypothetical protein